MDCACACGGTSNKERRAISARVYATAITHGSEADGTAARGTSAESAAGCEYEVVRPNRTVRQRRNADDHESSERLAHTSPCCRIASLAHINPRLPYKENRPRPCRRCARTMHSGSQSRSPSPNRLRKSHRYSKPTASYGDQCEV